MARHGLERIWLRNEFYRENYRYVALVVVLLFIMVFALLVFIFYQKSTWAKPKYFATTPDGRPIPVVRLDQPYFESQDVINWAKASAVAIYYLDYVTYRNSLQAAEVYFTTKGYKDYLSALKASTNLDAIKAKKQVQSAVITGDAIVSRQGQLTPDSPYSWDVKMPITVTYQNSENEIIKQDGTLILQVERTSLLRHKEGVAIGQWVWETH